MGPKINALVRETKGWLGKCKIGMSDKSETARVDVRERVLLRGDDRSFVLGNLASRLDQRRERAQRLSYCKERMLQ